MIAFKTQQLEETKVGAEQEAELKKRERERVKKLSPKLKVIYERVGLEWTDPDDKNANYQDLLDTEKLLNAIDVDHDNIVTYEELNVALRLEENQMKKFIKIMNQLGGRPLDSSSVDHDTFVDYFLDAMERAANYDPTPEEAAKIFEDIAQRQTGDAQAETIDLNGLLDTDLMFFLSYPQIISIIQDLKNIHSRSETIEEGGEESHDERLIVRSMSRQKSIVATRFGKLQKVTIDKRTFMAHYAFVLHHATLGSAEDLPQGVDVAFMDLSLNITVAGHSTPVVDKVTGRLRKKTMTALMGGSGAGKTSLLNSLCGRAFYGEVTGDIFINGHKTKIEKYMDNVGFVPQDDIVYAELTVKENLLFSGRFRLEKGVSTSEIEDLAEEVMANLGLTRVANTIVGDVTRRGVSGGEKKRVNIGLELMAKPSILFLDEPTSGLDANNAMLVMKGLRSLVQKKGVTVCSVIHQPRKSIFELFDCIILLGVGGKVVYHGPTVEAEKYFEKLGYVLPPGESVADWFIDISSGRVDRMKPKRSSVSYSMAAENQIELQSIKEKRNSKKSIMRPLEAEELEFVLSPIEETNEVIKAKLNRFKLYQDWENHIDSLDEESKKQYEVPDEFDLPKVKNKQSFFVQLWFHMLRNFIVQGRTITTKVIDTTVIIVALTCVTILLGEIQLTKDVQPNLRDEYDTLTLPIGNTITEFYRDLPRWRYIEAIQDLLKVSSSGFKDMVLFGIAVALITSTFLTLSAAKVLTEKRLELNREAGSGYNLNAYYLAVNITSTIEFVIQMILITSVVIWLRFTVTSYGFHLLNFIMMGWLCTSWSLVFPIVVPPSIIVVTLCIFNFIFGALFCGYMPPGTYDNIYHSKITMFFAGMLSTTRYFVESLLVSEFRVMPSHYGWTYLSPLWEKFGPDYLETKAASASDEIDEVVKMIYDLNAFRFLDVALHDMPNVTNQTAEGWYYNMLAPVLVGLTVRFLGAILLNICNRSVQARSPFFTEMKRNCMFLIEMLVVVCLFLLSFFLSLWVIGVIGASKLEQWPPETT